MASDAKRVYMTEEAAEELVAAVRMIFGLNGGPGLTLHRSVNGLAIGVNQGRAGQGMAGAWQRMQVTAIANDFLTCRTWDGTNLGTFDLYVARAVQARHVAANYQKLDGTPCSSFLTVAPQLATATFGTVAENWQINLPYFVGCEIRAQIVIGGTGVDAAPIWEDVNNSGRKWGQVQTS